MRSAIYPTANRGFARRLAQPPLAVRVGAGHGARQRPRRRRGGREPAAVPRRRRRRLRGRQARAAGRQRRRPLAGERGAARRARDRRAIAAAERLEALDLPPRGGRHGADGRARARDRRRAGRRRARRAAPARRRRTRASRPCSARRGRRAAARALRGHRRARARDLHAARGRPAGGAGDGAGDVSRAGAPRPTCWPRRRPATCACSGSSPPGPCRGSTREADAGVVLLRDRPIFAGALPTKLLECLAAGRPAVLSARGEAAELVEDAGAGLVGGARGPARAGRRVPGAARRPGAARAARRGRRARRGARAPRPRRVGGAPGPRCWSGSRLSGRAAVGVVRRLRFAVARPAART